METKKKEPIYKKWWFWVIAILILSSIINSNGLLLFVLAFLGFLTCIVLTIISAFKKNGKIKKFSISILVCFILMVTSIFITPSKSHPSKDITNTVENKIKDKKDIKTSEDTEDIKNNKNKDTQKVVKDSTEKKAIEDSAKKEVNQPSSKTTKANSNQEKPTKDIEKDLSNKDEPINNLFEGYTLIKVDGGNQSGHREPNVVVNVGFGDREYWAFTNEYGQLVKVMAKQIILQNDATEPVNSRGRYYPDEAKVPGVESKTLDEGHVIADSLGGVSNAYNITPQNSTLNRHGDQAYMEKVIRDAGGCTDFTAIITYPNTTTQIPSHYSYTYTLKGNVINDEFDNINPDEANAKIEAKTPVDNKAVTSTVSETATTNESVNANNTGTQIKIINLNKTAEHITLKNQGANPVNLKGWRILSVLGKQSFVFSEFILEPNSTVKIGDSAQNPDVNFHWLKGRGIWNNSKSDPAELYNSNGQLIDRYND